MLFALPLNRIGRGDWKQRESFRKGKEYLTVPAVEFAALIVACRKRRAQFLPDQYFGEPCWDMLLDLLVAHDQQREVTTAYLCTNSQVPYGTALRYLGELGSRGDVVEEVDAKDPRRILVRISNSAQERMTACLNDMIDLGKKQGFAV
jgi:hypothetical protein